MDYKYLKNQSKNNKNNNNNNNDAKDIEKVGFGKYKNKQLSKLTKK